MYKQKNLLHESENLLNKNVHQSCVYMNIDNCTKSIIANMY